MAEAAREWSQEEEARLAAARAEWDSEARKSLAETEKTLLAEQAERSKAKLAAREAREEKRQAEVKARWRAEFRRIPWKSSTSGTGAWPV